MTFNHLIDDYQAIKERYLHDHAALRLLYWTRLLGRTPTEWDYRNRREEYIDWISEEPLAMTRTLVALRQWRRVDRPRLYRLLNVGSTNRDTAQFLHERAIAVLKVQVAFGLDTADRNSADKAFLIGVDPHESDLLLSTLSLAECPYVQPEASCPATYHRSASVGSPCGCSATAHCGRASKSAT